jgi:hypothetical protein
MSDNSFESRLAKLEVRHEYTAETVEKIAVQVADLHSVLAEGKGVKTAIMAVVGLVTFVSAVIGTVTAWFSWRN